MYEFTFQLEEIYILITESSASVPGLVRGCGNEVGCCCALSSRQRSVSGDASPVRGRATPSAASRQPPQLGDIHPKSVLNTNEVRAATRG